MIEEAITLARQNGVFIALSAPLIGAALALAVPSARLAWFIVLLALIVSGVVAADLAINLLVSEAPTILVMPFAPLLVDSFTIMSASLCAALAVLAFAAGGVAVGEYESKAAPFAVALAAAIVAAWLAALAAEDVVALFFAVETAWLASIGLAAMQGERQRSALNGAVRMLVLGVGGAALILIGAGLAYLSLGTLAFAQWPLAPVHAPQAASVGVGLIVLGLLMKAGAAPFHLWVGAIFGRANALAMLMLGCVGMVGALCVIAKFAGYAIQSPAIGEGLSLLLAAIGATGVVFGSVQAVGASNLRRLAAYAGVAQAGSVLIALALGSPAGVAAALVQVTALGAGALALFAGAAAGGVHDLKSANGLARRAPLASLALTCGALNLMGAPLTIGFLGRWRMVEAGVGVDWWWAVGAVTVASLAGVFYGGRLIERLFFRRAEIVFEGPRDIWRLSLAPALLASIFVIGLGVAPGWLLLAAETAASFLVGGGA